MMRSPGPRRPERPPARVRAGPGRPARPGGPIGWRLAAVGAVAVHLVVLYAPRSPDTSGTPLPPWSDLVVHAAIFAAVTLTGLRARPPWGRHTRAIVVGLAAAHAPVSELAQHLLLAHRSGEPRDVAADLAGVALGVAAHLLVPGGRGRRATR